MVIIRGGVLLLEYYIFYHQNQEYIKIQFVQCIREPTVSLFALIHYTLYLFASENTGCRKILNIQKKCITLSKPFHKMRNTETMSLTEDPSPFQTVWKTFINILKNIKDIPFAFCKK